MDLVEMTGSSIQTYRSGVLTPPQPEVCGHRLTRATRATGADAVSDNLLIADQMNGSHRLLFNANEFSAPRSVSLMEFVRRCAGDQ